MEEFSNCDITSTVQAFKFVRMNVSCTCRMSQRGIFMPLIKLTLTFKAFPRGQNNYVLKLNFGKCIAHLVAPGDLMQALSDKGVGVRLNTTNV